MIRNRIGIALAGLVLVGAALGAQGTAKKSNPVRDSLKAVNQDLKGDAKKLKEDKAKKDAGAVAADKKDIAADKAQKTALKAKLPPKKTPPKKP